MFIRRLGESGRQLCSTGFNCPQVLEMENGDFAAAGVDITTEAIGALPPGPGVGPMEKVVRVPRSVMLNAIKDILTAA